MDDCSDTNWTSSTVIGRKQLSTNTGHSLRNHGTLSDHHAQDDQPRKYRLRKRRWQSDEDMLGEVLQQELLAWRDMPSDQHTLRRIVRSPAGLNDKEIAQLPPSLSEDMYSDRRIINSSNSPQDNDQSKYMINASTDGIKKSYFLEGSMNLTSRGTASTWIEEFSAPSITSRPISALSELDSEPSTPRNAPSSRASISSSIDINEFKPLPPTPTTFKATIKRLGHRFKPNDTSFQPKTTDTTPKPLKIPRKGLRKSLSTWRFFDGIASEADDEAIHSSPKLEHKTIKNTASSKTLRLLGRHKQQPQIDATVALLDERKRKAEIAYAEQFGTAKKRYKQDPPTIMRSEDTDDEPEPITMRRRTSRPRTPQSNDVLEYCESFVANTEILPPSLRLSTSASTIKQRVSHRRNSTSFSTSSKGSDRDRLKRVSRSELEKENHHLRELLRQREKQIRPTSSDQELPTSKIPRKSQDLSSGESSPVRDRMRAALSSHPVSEDDTLTERSLPSSDESKSAPLVEKIPPVPQLPSSLIGRGVLISTTNKPGWSTDTATVKRRGPVTTLGRAIELPRPLSMVLEGLEDDYHEDGEDASNAIKKTPSSGQPPSISAKRALPGLTDCKENWDWPEDVF